MSADASPAAMLEHALDCDVSSGSTAADATRYCTECGCKRVGDAPCGRCSSRATRLRGNSGADANRLSIRTALAMYGTLMAIIFLYVFFDSPRGEFIVSGVMSVGVLGFSVFVRRNLKPVLSKPAWKWCGIALLLGTVTFAMSHAAIEGLVLLVEGFEEMPLWYADDATYGIAAIVLVTCVQPAVMEELACRGVMFAALNRSLGAVETIVVTSFLFTLLHFSPMSWPHLFVTGVVLGCIRHYSGALLPCVVLHFTHNVLVVLTSN